MHRLLVPSELLRSDSVDLPPEAAHHLRVVRPRDGELVELFDGAGCVRAYRFGAPGCARGGAPARLSAAGEASFAAPRSPAVTLFACVTKGARWDWTVEKATELGVSRIVPVLSARCVVRVEARERAAKRERWRRIAEEAARQSDARWLPEVCEPMDFTSAAELAGRCVCFVGALTDPPPPPLIEVVGRHAAAGAGDAGFGLFVGPEGDFAPNELSALLEVAHPASFGPTILRAETAAIFGVSVLVAALAGVR